MVFGRFWVCMAMLLCCLVPAEASLLTSYRPWKAECSAPMMDSCFVDQDGQSIFWGDGETPWKNEPWSKWSWTPEFLRYMEALAVSTQTEAVDNAAMDTFDNVMILLDHPGQRSWRIYRPDPFQQVRPIFLDLQVVADVSLAEIQRRIVMHWPDLPNGQLGWTLVEVAPSSSTSLLVPEDFEIFLIRADVDCGPDERVVLVETQFWRLADFSMTPHLRPMVIPCGHDPKRFPQLVGWQDLCSRVLCPVWANGDTRRPLERLDIGHGSFVIVSATDDVDRIDSITGDLVNFPEQFRTVIVRADPVEIPADFAQQVAVAMALDDLAEQQAVRWHAITYQLALTDWYRWLYRNSGMRYIRRNPLALFHPTLPPGQPLVFLRFGVTLPLNVPELYADLVDYEMVPQEDWELIFMAHVISDLAVPQDVQYMGIATQTDREPPLNLNLALFELNFADEQGQFLHPPQFRSLMVKETTSWFALIHMVGFLPQCEEIWECVVQSDGRYVLPHEQDVFLYDGSIVRMWLGPYFREGVLGSEELDCSMTAEDLEGQAVLKPSSVARATQSTQPFAPVSQILQGAVAMVVLLLGWSLQRTFRTQARRYAGRRWKARGRSGLRLRRCHLGFCRRPLLSSYGRKVQWASLLYLCLSSHLVSISLAQDSARHTTHRFGEALHPGPLCHIGTSNPSGIRGKEMIYGQLPFGTWGISESHVAKPGLRTVRSNFARAGREYHRTFNVLPGVMVPLRQRSETAGTWAGVMTVADLPLRNIQINWPHGEYDEGRAQLYECHLGNFYMTGATVYGWPSGPTYPRALQHTNDLLETLVKELVLSRTGPRFLMGDFNHPEAKLDALAILHTQGWVAVQDLGFRQGQWSPVPTCKSSTTIDMVFISPELIPFFRSTQTWPWFSDHLIVGAAFELPIQPAIQDSWPLPAQIPWTQVNWDTWQTTESDLTDLKDLNLTEAYSTFWQRYEKSFNDHMATPDGLLPTTSHGRGRRQAPEQRQGALPLLRPSRPGEVTQSCELLGRTPQKWFVQLRRLQSMLHALRANNDSANAQQYRAELWGSILRAKAAHGGQSVRCSFKEANYRKMESWHQRHRHELLAAYFQEHHEKLFSMIKPEAKAPLQHLEDVHMTTILAMSEDQQLIHVADQVHIPEDAQCEIDGVPVKVLQVEDTVVSLEHETLFVHPLDFSVRVKYSSPQDVLGKLESFWKERWWKHSPPSTADWERMFAFAREYMPRRPLPYRPLHVEQWNEVNKRYSAKAARGPDGVDRRDLQWMPQCFKESLVALLNRIEAMAQWPEALLPGFVFPLPKRTEGLHAGDYRPVIIYSTVVRSWSSARARECLLHLSSLVDGHQFGFLPGKEATEIWFSLQAYLELCQLTGEERCGWVTDVQKAFENIPREPVDWLARAIGIPDQIVSTWSAFLQGTTRRFQVGGFTGAPLSSNSGYPEGCALSCFAMGLADMIFHLYLSVYSRMVTPVSYVDNLEVLAQGVHHLRSGINCTLQWAAMWRLSLDSAKSYTWASTPALRRELRTLDWELRESALDLGANMNYGKKKSVAAMVARLASLEPLWPLLKRLPVAEWKKWHILQQGLWAKAFYGCANCTIGPKHIQDLRTQAMRSLRRSRAGASPLICLGLQAPMGCDPGFYQFWQVLVTFRRLLVKQPVLQEMWALFLELFRGGQSHGPFGKLLDVCSLVGWTVTATGFYDHDGFWVSWLDSAEKKVRSLAEDAWAQHISQELCRRKDLSDLQGLDLPVFRRCQNRLDGKARKFLQPIQDGSFIDAKTQSKFDVSKMAICSTCHVPDTHAHRCTMCPHFHEVHRRHSNILALCNSLPQSLTHHLLPSRDVAWADYKNQFLAMEPFVERHIPVWSTTRMDFFTDGSCWTPEIPELSLGAWAVVPQLDCWIARGTLSGLHQNNDAAELQAIREALEIAVGFPGEITIWSDSSYAATGLHRLLENVADLPDDSGDGTWIEIQALVRQCVHPVRVQHIAAHRDSKAQSDPVDEWTARWNTRADQDAAMAHFLRPQAFLESRSKILSDYQNRCEQLRQLQALHLDISEFRLLHPSADDDEGEEHTEATMRVWWHARCHEADGTWVGQIEESWVRHLPSSDLVQQFGLTFPRRMIIWLLEQSGSDDVQTVRWTWLELAIYWLKRLSDFLPSPTSDGRWADAMRVSRRGRALPTVNESVDCLERNSAFPECSAVGRELADGQVTRLCLDFTAESDEGVFAQLGLVRLHPDDSETSTVSLMPTPAATTEPPVPPGEARRCGRLTVFTPVVSSVFFTTAGDIFGSSKIEVVEPGVNGRCVCHRADDWWSGAPSWFLGGDRRQLRLFMEVDLGKRPSVSFRLETFHQAPIVVTLPELDDTPSTPWMPCVSITQGQTVRIVELQLLSDGSVDQV
eukprot:s140_g66.t1